MSVDSLVERNIELTRNHSIISFKDTIILSLLFCRDLFDIFYNIAESYKSKPIETPFADFTSYLYKLKDRRYSKITSFRRLRKEKIIRVQKEKISFDLSSKFYQELVNFKFRFFVAPEKWDGNWTLVLFDIPEQYRSHRNYLRKFLVKLGFVQWQRSVWVTINKVSNWLNKVFENWDLGLDLWSFQAKSLFQGNDQKAIKELFSYEDLESEYEVFVENAQSAIKNKNEAKLKQFLEYFPDLILNDRGVPGEFFDDPKIRQKLWKVSQRMKDALMDCDSSVCAT